MSGPAVGALVRIRGGFYGRAVELGGAGLLNVDLRVTGLSAGWPAEDSRSVWVRPAHGLGVERLVPVRWLVQAGGES